ncbi:Serine/threonine exchanger SteT [Morus notabilis]|uniref:Serine/threonine exchanger SteT n=1 Tax=Morus notabilis TaxID=981085 RepID=W9SG08_9ROSA|nr:probable polyamine transporter At3g13620 [Morus notabilis]EXC30898.1 Serine/threonine exchanger SteT [Morus notabilis]
MGTSNSDITTKQLLLDHHDHDVEVEQPPTDQKHPNNKLSLIPLIFLIYFEVSGGPYGEESAVGAAGPLLAILGFLIFPFIWSIPEALVTAELATAFPGNGGFVIWANKAFGPFWGSLMGSWKFLSGVINLASYPVLCVDYLKLVIPILSSGFPRYFAILVSTLVLSFLNYTGLTIVGYTAVALGIVSLLPFLLMTLLAIPKVDPVRWISFGQESVTKDWALFFNTLFWNLNFWDNASTLAGEVEQPQKTYPKALFSAVILSCFGYLLPLLAATGAIPLNQENWVDGYLANVAEMIAGKWLKIWIELGAVLSVIGLFEAQLTSSAYQILGMAELGFLPRIFGARSKWFNTPWLGILVSTMVPLVVSYMDFANIISSANFLYSLGMLLEFSSFLWLRKKLPQVKRPFSVPMGLGGLVFMCLIPSGFLVYVMAVATKPVLLISTLLTLFGIAWYFFMNICRKKMWFEFNKGEEKLDGEDID